MILMHDPTILPADLPVPEDDGAARHLTGIRIPSLPSAATDGTWIDLGKPVGRTVIYIDGVIAKVFYPVFPPDESAAAVVSWLRASR